MKCIFCKNEIGNHNSTKEHIIPQFFGGKYFTYNVCKNCNNIIGGNFESTMSKDPLITFILSFFQMKKKTGKYFTPHILLQDGDDKYIIKSDGEGCYYMHFITQNIKIENKYTMRFDRTESSEYIESTLNKKIERLNAKYGGNIPPYNKNTKNNFKVIESLGLGNPIEFNFEFETHNLNKLFAKIAYEFTGTCLNSRYLMDYRGKILKNSLKLEKDEFNRFMESEGENFIYSINTKKIIICIENVIKTSQENTIRNMSNLKHIPPSNGNYIHKISLIKRNKQLFIGIDLFNIFKSKICVSNNCDKYEFNNGTIAEMICGRKNDETIKRINSNYEEIVSNLNFSI